MNSSVTQSQAKVYSLVKIDATKQARRAELRKAYELHEAAQDRISPRKKNGWRVVSVEEQAQIAAVAPWSNELSAELETLDFLADPPVKAFVYPKSDQMGIRLLTGFTGNTLAHVSYLGRKFRSNLGDERQSVRAVGINGIRYNGTIYGTYARLAICKAALSI